MKIFRNLVFSIFLSFLFLACDGEQKTTAIPKPEIEVTALESTDKSDYYEYNLRIPQISNAESEDIVYFNLTMQENIRTIIDDLANKDEWGIQDASISFEEHKNDYNMVSITLLRSIHTVGGAHYDTTLEAYNINKKDNSLMTFEKLFTDDDIEHFNMLINDKIRNHVQIKNIQGAPCDLYEEAEADIRNAVFYFEGEDLVFVFQEYDLGPHSSGMPVFKFSRKDIKKHINLDI